MLDVFEQFCWSYNNNPTNGHSTTYIFDNHDEEGQFDTESFLGIGRTCDERCAHIRTNNLQHRRLNVLIRNSLDVTVSHYFVCTRIQLCEL